jgi:subtilisin family serine protease
MASVFPDAPRTPDADPFDIESHGTHVAGIIAGKDGK